MNDYTKEFEKTRETTFNDTKDKKPQQADLA